MGCDWKIYINGEEVDEIYRLCSGNHYNIWKKYDFDYNVMHGHDDDVIVDYLTKIIDCMASDGIRDFSKDQYMKECEKNPNFSWGNKDGVKLPEEVRSSIVLHQLKYYREVAERNPGGVWSGDQAHYNGPYTMPDGTIVKGNEYPKI
jgi:hypothetical protein